MYFLYNTKVANNIFCLYKIKINLAKANYITFYPGNIGGWKHFHVFIPSFSHIPNFLSELLLATYYFTIRVA